VVGWVCWWYLGGKRAGKKRGDGIDSSAWLVEGYVMFLLSVCLSVCKR